MLATRIFASILSAVLALILSFDMARSVQCQHTRELTAATPNTSNKRTALVIGNANYTVAPKLANSVNDAMDMSAALKELGFEVVTGTDLTLKQMHEKVREFGDKLRSNGGVGLFYYAGHGVQVKSANYLIPIEIDNPNEDEIEFVAFSIDRLFGKLAMANNGSNIVILDACRNNPFARAWSRGLDSGGLAQMSAPPGTMIVYSTDPNNTAADGTGRNGTYTAELLKCLSRPYIKVEETFKATATAVRSATGGRQTPWTSSSFSGDFYFLPQMTNVSMYSRWQRMIKRRDFQPVVDETEAELKTNPNSVVALRMNAHAIRENDLRLVSAIKTYKSSQIRDLLKHNIKPKDEYELESICYFYAFHDSSNTQSGIAACTKAIESNVTLDLAFRSRAEINWKRKNFELADADLLEASRIDPEYADYPFKRAEVLKALKKHDSAVRELTRALTLEPENADYYYSRGYSYLYDLKQHNLALDDVEQAIRFAKPERLVNYLRLRIAVNSLAKRYDLALLDYARLIEMDRNDHLSFQRRGEIYLEGKNYAQAIADFSDAIRILDLRLESRRGLSSSDGFYLGLLSRLYEKRYIAHKAIKEPELAEADRLKALAVAEEEKVTKSRAAVSIAIAATPIKTKVKTDTAVNPGKGSARNEAEISGLTTLVGLTPESSAHRYDRGVLYALEKKYDLAIMDFTETIRLNFKQLEYARQKGDTKLELLVLRYLRNVYQRRSSAYSTIGQNDLADADSAKAIEFDNELKSRADKQRPSEKKEQ